MTNKKLPYPYDEAREKAVDKAIESIKTCPYHGTGIKIELEALFMREGSRSTCATCNGVGEVICRECKDNDPDCVACSGKGVENCQGCNGNGLIDPARNRLSKEECHSYVMEHISQEAKNALVYAKTYRDGSVDTELTFTMKIEDVRYAIEVVKAFNELGTVIGAGTHTQGAGMHMTILNSPDCYYPDRNSLDKRRAANFKYTMTRFMPALMFLASSDHRSRRLGYRRPEVAMNNKYSAITGYGGCFEFRIFETCYQRPEAILDNLCVIANCLKFYSYRKKTFPFFGKIGRVGFSDIGQGIQRFFDSETNYRALLAGVKVLRPSYKSMESLRKERNFHLTLMKIKQKESKIEGVWRGEYHQHQKDFELAKQKYVKEYENMIKDPASYNLNLPQFVAQYPNKLSYVKHKLSTHVAVKETEESYVKDQKDKQLERVDIVIDI